MLVLLLASFLRLYRLDLMEFKDDEAQAAFLVVQALEGERFPIHGLMSSVGIYNSPVFIYLLLLPGIFSFEPVGFCYFIALLNIGAVFLCYWFGRKIFNPWVGQVAALFFAVSPWAIIYSRKIWAQDCLPLFSLLLMGGLYELCVNGDRRWFLPAALSAVLMPGIHFSGFIAAAVFVLFVGVCRIRVDWKAWLVVGVVSAGAYLPYLLKYWSTGRMGSGLSLERFSMNALVYPVQISSHFNFDYLLGGSSDAFREFLTSPIFWLVTLTGFVISLLFMGGFVWLTLLLYRERKDSSKPFWDYFRSNSGRSLCWIWTALPLVGFLVLSIDKSIFPHYFIILYPVQFWLAAAFLDAVCRNGTMKYRRAVSSAVVVFALVEALFMIRFLHFVGTEGGAAGDYGVTYVQKREAAAYIARSCKEDKTAPVLFSNSQRSLLDYQYLISLDGVGTSGDEDAIRKILIVEDFKNVPKVEGALSEKSFGPVRVAHLEDVQINERRPE